MRADSLHVTLAFVGEVDAAARERLRAIGAGIGEHAFRMVLDHCGLWRHNGIFQAGCRRTPSGEVRLFEALAGRLREAGFPVDARPHAPHVTLLRKAGATGGVAPGLATEIEWDVREFSLVESTLGAEGSRYRIRDRWALAAAPAAGPGSDAGIG